MNEQRAQAGDPRGLVECVMLTNHMRDVIPDAEQRIKNYLTQFVDAAIEDKESDGLLLYASTQMFGFAIRLTPSVIRPFVTQLKRETERRKLVNPKIIKFEGTRGFGGSPVAYKNAARQLLDGYVPITNRYVNAKFGFDYPAGFHDNSDLLLAWCKQKYKIATKQELVLDGMPSEDTTYWADQKKLFDISTTNQHAAILGVVQRDDSVFIALNQRDETPRTTLMEFDLAAGTQHTVSTLEGRMEPYYLWSTAPWSDSNLSHSRMSAGNESVYLPGDNGLVIFPRNGDIPRFLRSGKDLPDAAVVAVIEIGEALYIACERMIFKNNMKQSVLGMLLKADLHGNNQHVLASSERKEAHSPLDNTDPYFIEGFQYDKDGDQLYFMIGRNGGSNKNLGMWQLNLKSGVFTHVEKRHIGLLKEFAPQEDGTVWFECANTMYAWDPHKGAIRLLMESYRLNTIPRARCAAMLNEVLYVRSVKPVWDLGREGLIRVEMKNAGNQPMALEPFLAHPPIFVNAWQGNLIAADQKSLWLLTPNDKDEI